MAERIAESVKVFLYNDRGVLLLKRALHDESRPDTWDLPGGGVEPDETTELAAVREVEEETKLVIPEWSESDEGYGLAVPTLEHVLTCVYKRKGKDYISVKHFRASRVANDAIPIVDKNEHQFGRFVPSTQVAALLGHERQQEAATIFAQKHLGHSALLQMAQIQEAALAL